VGTSFYPDVCENSLPPTGIRSPDLTTRSQLPYRLRCPTYSEKGADFVQDLQHAALIDH
jgi:hypothetical protein